MHRRHEAVDDDWGAEFDIRLPHWFGSTGQHAVEILGLFGRQGERIHVRAKPRRRDPDNH